MEQLKNIPSLRFPEFSGNWEMKKLKDIIEFKAGYAFKSELMLSNKSNYQLLKMSNVYQNELRLDRNPSYWQNIDNKQKEFLLKKGDTILTLTGTVGKQDYGYSVQIMEDNKYLLNQRLVLLRGINNRSDSDFISKIVSNDKFLYFFFSEAKGGTGNQTNVSIEDVKNICLNFPPITEQTKIASFLTKVDDKLTALKKKKELLEQYKKGVMQQIFSQELRFKDDNGNDYPDWVTNTLGEIAEIKKGKQLNKEELTQEGKYLCINGGISPSGYTDKFNTLENTITISEGGNSCGYVNFFTCKFWSGGHNYSLEIKNNEINNNDFIFQVLKQNQSEIMKLRVGSGLPNIQKKDLSAFELVVPNDIEEQSKIADFLSTIDNKISYCQSQIEKAEVWKKGLLQQMFC